MKKMEYYLILLLPFLIFFISIFCFCYYILKPEIKPKIVYIQDPLKVIKETKTEIKYINKVIYRDNELDDSVKKIIEIFFTKNDGRDFSFEPMTRGMGLMISKETYNKRKDEISNYLKQNYEYIQENEYGNKIVLKNKINQNENLNENKNENEKVILNELDLISKNSNLDFDKLFDKVQEKKNDYNRNFT